MHIISMLTFYNFKIKRNASECEHVSQLPCPTGVDTTLFLKYLQNHNLGQEEKQHCGHSALLRNNPSLCKIPLHPCIIPTGISMPSTQLAPSQGWRIGREWNLLFLLLTYLSLACVLAFLASSRSWNTKCRLCNFSNSAYKLNAPMFTLTTGLAQYKDEP